MLLFDFSVLGSYLSYVAPFPTTCFQPINFEIDVIAKFKATSHILSLFRILTRPLSLALATLHKRLYECQNLIYCQWLTQVV